MKREPHPIQDKCAAHTCACYGGSDMSALCYTLYEVKLASIYAAVTSKDVSPSDDDPDYHQWCIQHSEIIKANRRRIVFLPASYHTESVEEREAVLNLFREEQNT